MTIRSLAAIPWLAVGVAVLAGLVQAAAAVGWRQGWWPLSASFDIMRWTAYAAFPCLAASAVALAIAGARRGRRMAAVAAAGVVLSVGVLVTPLDFNARRALPPINDIATDTANPPAFLVYPVGESGNRTRPIRATPSPRNSEAPIPIFVPSD